jgi:REP element-mobilizing transposase RayT
LHFEGKRYVLGTWTIMPNHVHAILKPLTGFALKDILNSWKSYSARRINANLGTSGALWERESFDHLIRDDSHLERLISYVDQNAVVAGLCDSPSEWAFSARGVGFTRSRLWFEDPRTTPFVAPRTRGELAHLHKPGGVYFVTWRLLDAVRLGRGGKSAGLETCTTKRDPE